jgi:hypothetical protein
MYSLYSGSLDPLLIDEVSLSENETEEQVVKEALEEYGHEPFLRGHLLVFDETKEIRTFIEIMKVENGKLKLLQRREMDDTKEIAREVFDPLADLDDFFEAMKEEGTE